MKKFIASITLAITAFVSIAPSANAMLPREDRLFISEANPCPENLTAGQPRSPFDADAITACIRWVWPDDIEERAIAIVFGESPGGELSAPWRGGGRCAESRGNPNAQGKNYRNGKLHSVDTGVFQINSGNKSIFTKAGFDWFMVQYDPEVNAQAALYLYEASKSGWKNWTCSNRAWGKKG